MKIKEQLKEMFQMQRTLNENILNEFGEEREDGYKPSQDEMVNSMEDFKELVERATPKKICHTKEEGSFTFNFGRCECGREILSANDYVKYCPCCGQALDWRVENEKI